MPRDFHPKSWSWRNSVELESVVGILILTTEDVTTGHVDAVYSFNWKFKAKLLLTRLDVANMRMCADVGCKRVRWSEDRHYCNTSSSQLKEQSAAVTTLSPWAPLGRKNTYPHPVWLFPPSGPFPLAPAAQVVLGPSLDALSSLINQQKPEAAESQQLVTDQVRSRQKQEHLTEMKGTLIEEITSSSPLLPVPLEEWHIPFPPMSAFWQNRYIILGHLVQNTDQLTFSKITFLAISSARNWRPFIPPYSALFLFALPSFLLL